MGAYEISENIKDERKLLVHQLELGDYDIAFSLYSFGDVIEFVQHPKQGVILIDTCGHQNDFGKQMQSFLKQQIKSGWGSKGDAREELTDLGRKLADVNGPAKLCEGDDWCDGASGLYVQLNKTNISFSSNGGMGQSFIFRNNKKECLDMYGTYLDDLHQHEKGALLPVYTSNLGLDDVLLLQSDGINGNMMASIHYGHSNESSRTDFIDTLMNVRKKEPFEIVNYANHALRNVIKNIDLCYDDMSFVVIKKKKSKFLFF